MNIQWDQSRFSLLSRKSRISLSLFLTAVAMVLASCGGTDPGSSPGRADFVRLDQYSIDTTSASLGKAFTIAWTAAFSSPSSLYTFEWHLGAQSSIGADSLVLTVNCGPATQPCSNSGQIACEYKNNNAGSPALICSIAGKVIGQKLISNPGKFVATGRACIFDSSLAYVCDNKDAELTLS